MPLIPRNHITFYIKDNLAERLAFNQTNQAIHVDGKDKLRDKMDNKNETSIFFTGEESDSAIMAIHLTFQYKKN